MNCCPLHHPKRGMTTYTEHGETLDLHVDLLQMAGIGDEGLLDDFDGDLWSRHKNHELAEDSCNWAYTPFART